MSSMFPERWTDEQLERAMQTGAHDVVCQTCGADFGEACRPQDGDDVLGAFPFVHSSRRSLAQAVRREADKARQARALREIARS